MNEPILWYFADPMCSWCWGFSPVIEALRKEYRERLKVALVLGGLRPGTTEPMSSESRADILHHWQAVQARTGQPFRFEGALPEGFVYDTEPPARAVVAVGGLVPEATFPMFTAVQSAFYAQGRDVTRPEVLVDLAREQGVDGGRFLEAFGAEKVRQRTRAHFGQARQWGIRGFPSVVLEDPEGYVLLASGWRPLEELRPQIDAWLGPPGGD
jgi:putative protein-disulfide isomerase